MRKTAAKRLPDSRRGKMIPLGCNMYVVLKVQNENGSRLVIVFLLPFLYFYPIFFLYILLKYFLNQFIKWYECQKVFCHSFDTSDCDPATLLPQSSKYSKSADLLRKSLLSHIWRVPSSKALSCKHEQLFDLLTLVSLELYKERGICICAEKYLWRRFPTEDFMN